MKKSLFFAPLALALVACSEKDVADPTGGLSGDVDHSYLSVTIVPSQTSGTRAVPEGDDYRDGTEVENEVKSIRFYFFDKDGKAAPVKYDGASYYDVQPDEIKQEANSDATVAGPVESIISAMIVIESNKGDGKPAYMAAVLNHNGQAPKDMADIAALQAYVADYSAHTQGNFAMSSTVYKGKKWTYKDAEKEGDLEFDQEIDDQELVAIPVYEHIKNSRQDALENKATIYVERVLAKVSTKVNITEATHKAGVITTDDGEELYKVGYVGNQGLIEEPEDATKIYVKFLGWNVTADRKKSRLVKKVNTDWTMKNDPEDWRLDWNDNGNYRSYWALNPDNGTSSTPIEDHYNFDPFATETASGSGVWGKDPNLNQAWSFDFKTNNATYLQENAGSYESNGTAPDVINSKIIVAAQLVDENNKPLSLVEWQGDIYSYGTDAEKKAVLDALAADTDLYIQEADGTWRKLQGSDVEIVFYQSKDADTAYKENEGGKRRYYVYLELKNKNARYGIYKFEKAEGTNESKWWIDINTDKNGYDYNDPKIDAALDAVGYIKYWNTGYTYYWVDIRHFGQKENVNGYYGVVRNHWYDYTFTDVKGLGVPVANPNEVIWPEVPGDPEYFYLAAEVKILSWRIVHNPDTGLGW